MSRVTGSPRLALGLLLATTCSGTTESTPPVASLRISPDSLQLEVGTSAQLTAIALDASGAQVTGVSVAFTSADTAVAAATLSGQVTGRRSRPTTIPASGGQGSAATPGDVRAPPHPDPNPIL